MEGILLLYIVLTSAVIYNRKSAVWNCTNIERYWS